MKVFEAGSNIELKDLGDKILVTAKNTTRIKETNFELEAEQIIIKAGAGIIGPFNSERLIACW